MREAMTDFVFWWLGAALVGLASIALTGVFMLVAYWLSGNAAKYLASFVRFSTARYWVARMEKEGLTVMQKEYRRMVREKKPKSPRDFYQVEADAGAISKEQSHGQ